MKRPQYFSIVNVKRPQSPSGPQGPSPTRRLGGKSLTPARRITLASEEGATKGTDLRADVASAVGQHYAYGLAGFQLCRTRMPVAQLGWYLMSKAVDKRKSAKQDNKF